MRTVRSFALLLACGGLVLATSASNAVTNYTFAGKFTSNRGKIINIPMVGNTPCIDNAGAGKLLTVMTGPGTGGNATPAVHKFKRGVNTQPSAPVNTAFDPNVQGRDLRCVKHAANKILQTTGTGMKGGGFVIPPKVWSKPLFKGYIRAEEVKYAPPVLQLATSFAITGPLAARTTPAMGTMVNVGMTNIAAFHGFKKSAWKTQTGRAAANFAWCPASPLTMNNGKGAPCANIGAAGPNLIVRYTAGGNSFGGTMAYVITAPAGISNLAVGESLPVVGPAAAFLRLTGMGSQPTGRGYADFLTDYLAPGPIHAAPVFNNVYEGPILKTQKLITMINMTTVAMVPKGTNFNFGFPFTTGTVLVRKTGATGTSTLTAMGYDKRNTPTAMGKKNISMVAGGLAVAHLAGLADTPTPEIATMLLTLPEPGSTAQLLAGVMSLLGIAAWRSRKVRRA